MAVREARGRASLKGQQERHGGRGDRAVGQPRDRTTGGPGTHQGVCHWWGRGRA